jgi:cytochrome d ubiquinol oxidase subunit II
VASSLALVGVIGTAGASMFPFIMPSSSMPQASLTVWDSVSSHLTHGDHVLGDDDVHAAHHVIYTSWAYSVMRGKVTAAYVRENDHAAY